MAEIESNRDSMFNVQKAIDPKGHAIKVVNNMHERNPVLRDFPNYPANGGRTHHGARTASLPAGTISTLGGGWTASFARLQPYTAGTMIMRSRYEIPTDVLHAQNEPGAYRLGQEARQEEGMSQSLANALIYGNAAAAPEKLDGLSNTAPWNSLSNTNSVWDMGGGSNLRSIWLININGPETVHFIHPSYAENVGMTRTDMGEKNYTTTLDANDASGGERIVTRTEYEWQIGWVVNDQRAVKRICNINYALTAMSTDLVQQILQARLLDEIGGQWFAYCDARIHTQLIIMAGQLQNVRYSAENPYRVSLPMIGDIIIRRMDALRYTSAGVETTEPAVA